ncbi:ZIP family metal transporter [Patescibacteria group bacterium]|nr:ZIP family metal transporter [Patescibacteria group bacterium]MDE1946293.1 ZIP family metal transporter [Patescibacteria group bacterium]MDE2010745.1 ZIP family metal transporter [Patescibacteria group bacterium]MDE2232629.1 ZIP family metal transporter [Patescibacteria group bacterium]
MVIAIAIATFVSTLLGGLFALKLKDKLHLVLGFSAGAVVAVAFFDLLPESVNLGSKFYSANTMLAVAAVGFMAYLILDRVIFLHAHAHSGHEGHECDHDTESAETKKMHRGVLGAGSLCLHSFLDGVAIGLAFQVSAAVGAIVAIAVLTHDFSDGINTVGIVLRHGNRGEHKTVMRWLFADALSPVLGAGSTLFFTVPERGLSIILALFAGFFLYIGASDLIPESHHAHPKLMTTMMTLLGAGILYAAITIAG